MTNDTPWEVVYLYLLESHRGRLTRGFASLQVDLLTVQTGLKTGELKRRLKAMQDEHLIVILEIDETAVDLAVTAVGMAKYVARSGK